MRTVDIDSINDILKVEKQLQKGGLETNSFEFEIKGRKIGFDHDPLVIAEIGINHGGSLDIAKKMADLAINAGVDVIKHQTHIVEDEMSSQADLDVIDYIGKSIYKAHG